MVNPCKSKSLNVFDAITLHIMISVLAISLFESFGLEVLSTIIIVSVTLPLMAFGMLKLMVYKEKIKEVFTCCKSKADVTSNNNEISPRDTAITIDEYTRNR